MYYSWVCRVLTTQFQLIYILSPDTSLQRTKPGDKTSLDYTKLFDILKSFYIRLTDDRKRKVNDFFALQLFRSPLRETAPEAAPSYSVEDALLAINEPSVVLVDEPNFEDDSALSDLSESHDNEYIDPETASHTAARATPLPSISAPWPLPTHQPPIAPAPQRPTTVPMSSALPATGAPPVVTPPVVAPPAITQPATVAPPVALAPLVAVVSPAVVASPAIVAPPAVVAPPAAGASPAIAPPVPAPLATGPPVPAVRAAMRAVAPRTQMPETVPASVDQLSSVVRELTIEAYQPPPFTQTIEGVAEAPKTRKGRSADKSKGKAKEVVLTPVIGPIAGDTPEAPVAPPRTRRKRKPQ